MLVVASTHDPNGIAEPKVHRGFAMPGPWKWFPAIGSPANRALDGTPSIVGRRSMRLDRRAAHRVKRLGGGSVARWRLCRIVRSWRGTMLAGFAMGKTSSCPQRRAMPRWSASGSRWPRECTPPVARGSSSTTTNDRNDRNDRAPRLWAGRPWSRASVPNLASSLLLACVGLFALPGQAQTAVFIPSGVTPPPASAGARRRCATGSLTASPASPTAPMSPTRISPPSPAR